MSGSSSEEEVVVRRPRAERPERQVHVEDVDPPGPQVTIEEGGETPEDFLADQRRQLQDASRREANERRLRQDAERRAADAERNAAANKQTDRQTVLGTMVDGAKAEAAAAKSAWKSARETGDIDAEIAATDALTTANARIQAANAEIEWLKTQKQPEQQAGPRLSPDAQRWVDDHPLYGQEGEYRDDANLAHGKALRAGHPEGSRSYVDYIDRLMTDKYGDGHGQIGQQQMSDDDRLPPRRQQPQARSGDALTPSRRGNPASANGWKTARAGNFGSIQWQDTPNGGRRVRFPGGEQQRIDWEEATKINFPKQYEADPKGALAEYCNEMIADAMEVEADPHGGGVTRHGEGRRYT